MYNMVSLFTTYWQCFSTWNTKTEYLFCSGFIRSATSDIDMCNGTCLNYHATLHRSRERLNLILIYIERTFFMNLWTFSYVQQNSFHTNRNHNFVNVTNMCVCVFFVCLFWGFFGGGGSLATFLETHCNIILNELWYNENTKIFTSILV